MSWIKIKHLVVALIGYLIVTPAQAQDDFGLFETVKNSSLPTGTPSPVAIVATIIQIILSVVGVVAMVLILYAGWQWMTAAGNEEKISSAKKIIAGAIVGLVLIFSSYIIADFIFRGISTSITPSALTNTVEVECDFDNDCSSDGSRICNRTTKTCEDVIAPCVGQCLNFSEATSNCAEASTGHEACEISNPGTRCFVQRSYMGPACP